MITLTNLRTNVVFTAVAHHFRNDRCASGDDMFTSLVIDSIFISSEYEEPFKNRSCFGDVFRIETNISDGVFFGLPLSVTKNRIDSSWRISFYLIQDNLRIVTAVNESLQNTIITGKL